MALLLGGVIGIGCLLLLSFCAQGDFIIRDGGCDDDYDYSGGPLGPAYWGDLRPEWSQCKEGQMQSPVAIVGASAIQNQSLDLTTSYDKALVNHTFCKGPQIAWISDGGSLYWNQNDTYKPIQMHWHIPSEHTIDGVRFPLELHMVHQGPSEELLVVGIMYTKGHADPFISSVMSWDFHPHNITLRDIQSDYFHYMGSLTTPPCDEGVTWILLQKVLQVSPKQLEFFRKNIPCHNARPLQPVNDRQIYKYTQELLLADA